MADAAEVLEWRGRTAVGADGSKLGKIEEIYVDEATDRPEWASIHTGMFARSSLMPLRGVHSDGDQVTAPYTKDQVKDAPNVDPDRELSPEEERGLYEHYGIAYGQSRPDSGRAEGDPGGGRPHGRDDAGEPDQVGRDVSGPTTDDAMTRSEEEPRVGTTRRESRARLRRYVVTEEEHPGQRGSGPELNGRGAA